MRIIPRKTKVTTEFFRGVTWIDMLVGAFGVLLIFFTVLSSLPYKFRWVCGILFVLVVLLIRVDDDANYMFLFRIIKHLAYKRRYRKFSEEELEACKKTKKKKADSPQEKKMKMIKKAGRPVKDSGGAEEENEQDESKNLSETE